MTRNIPPRSPGTYLRGLHSIRPSRAHSRTLGVATGATTRTEASAANRLSIFDSATVPAPTTRHRRPSSFTNIGNRLIFFQPPNPASRFQLQPPTSSLQPPFSLRHVQAALVFREA